MNRLRDAISHAVRSYVVLGSYTPSQFVNHCNVALEENPNYTLYNRRDRQKTVTAFRISSGEHKVTVRYEGGNTGTMLIKNVMRNLISIERDIWEEEDEEREQELMFQRMGIRV